MAMALNAGQITRQDEFLIDPKEIAVDDELNGRWDKHSEADIESMIHSFATEGQLQAVQVRRVQDNRVQLVLGYRRHAAALLHNQRNPESPMKLRCRVVQVNDEEAFRRNVVENRERKDATPVDDAYNQRRLREQYGWNENQIAEFYHYSASYVSTLAKLLTLPKKVQRQVHEKKLSVATATAVADLAPTEQEEVLKDVPEEGTPLEEAAESTGHLASSNDGKARNGRTPSNKEVMRRTRNKLIEKGKGKGRSLAEVRTFLEGMATGEGKPKDCAMVLLRYIKGTIKDETAAEKLAELLS